MRLASPASKTKIKPSSGGSPDHQRVSGRKRGRLATKTYATGVDKGTSINTSIGGWPAGNGRRPSQTDGTVGTAVI